MLSGMLRGVARILRLVISAAAAVLLAGSFGWVGYRTIHREGLAPGQVQLTIIQWGDKTEDAIVARLVGDFEQLPENRDIRIHRVNLGQADKVNTKLQTMFAAGEPPDAFYLDFAKVADFAEKNLLLDIQPLIDADKAAGIATVDLDDFFPAVLRSYRYDDQTHLTGAPRGRLVGLPKDFTT